MRTKLIWGLVIVLCLSVFALTGCKKENTPTAPEAPAAEQSAGGWTVSTEAAAPAIPETALEAFEAATSALTDADYEPIAFLAVRSLRGATTGSSAVCLSPKQSSARSRSTATLGEMRVLLMSKRSRSQTTSKPVTFPFRRTISPEAGTLILNLGLPHCPRMFRQHLTRQCPGWTAWDISR